MAEVVALLKTQIDPELLKREQEKAAEADKKKENTEGREKWGKRAVDQILVHQSANILLLLPSDLFLLGEVKKQESSSDEDSQDAVTCSTSPKDTWTKGSVKHAKAEAAPEASSGDAAAEVSVCSNEPLVKTEPLDVADRRTIAESSAVSIKTENGEEVKTNGEVRTSSSEEFQQALKSQQQAKIPLKKRGMKFSKDFHKNSNIIVPNASPQQEDKRPSLNDHVNGDVQPKAEAELQSGPKPLELETLQQNNPPSEETPAAASPSPEHSSHQCEKGPEDHTHTDGPCLKTEQCRASTQEAATQLEEGLPDSRGETEDIRELLESEGQEAPPGSMLPPTAPDMHLAQKQSSQEAETAQTTCREAPEKEEAPEEQMPKNTDAGEARVALEQEAGQEKDQATPPSQGSGSVEAAGEEPPPSQPYEGTSLLGETDLKPARTEEEKSKSPTRDNTNDDKNTGLLRLDPPAETNKEEEKLDKEEQKIAEDHVSEKASDVNEGTDKTEQQTKEQVQREEAGKASNHTGTSPEMEVVNGGEALAGSQATSKRVAHRRRAQVQAEDWPDTESDANVGRSLRRSPRISRPTAKTVESHDKSSQNSTPAEKQEDEKSRKDREEEEEDEVKATQKKAREKKEGQEGQTKLKVRQLNVSSGPDTDLPLVVATEGDVLLSVLVHVCVYSGRAGSAITCLF